MSTVAVRGRAPKRGGRGGGGDFDPPPVKTWLRAKFQGVKTRKGDWDTLGFNFRFKVIDPVVKDEGLNCGTVWGLQWEPAYPGRDLYEWFDILSDGELSEQVAAMDDPDDNIEFDVSDYTGTVVEVFVTKKKGTGKSRGKVFYNVTDIRKPRRGAKSKKGSKRTSGSKSRRRRPAEDEPPRRKKKRSTAKAGTARRSAGGDRRSRTSRGDRKTKTTSRSGGRSRPAY